VDESLMAGKHPALVDVRLMERLDLADRGRPTHACDDMLDAVSAAELRELRPAASRGVELAASIRQDLLRLPVPLHGFL